MAGEVDVFAAVDTRGGAGNAFVRAEERIGELRALGRRLKYQHFFIAGMAIEAGERLGGIDGCAAIPAVGVTGGSPPEPTLLPEMGSISCVLLVPVRWMLSIITCNCISKRCFRPRGSLVQRGMSLNEECISSQ